MVTRQESYETFNNKAKGTTQPGENYWDTMSYSEAMRARWYEYVDGRWQ